MKTPMPTWQPWHSLGPYLPLRNQVGQCSARYDHQISFIAIL